jgi:hypothetical protein
MQTAVWQASDRLGVKCGWSDEHLQIGIGEELLELLDGFPLVDDHYETVANAEAVADSARGFGPFRDRGELAGPVGESCRNVAVSP